MSDRKEKKEKYCEWVGNGTIYYKTSCGFRLAEYFDTNAIYCKQCGKRIKIVMKNQVQRYDNRCNHILFNKERMYSYKEFY